MGGSLPEEVRQAAEMSQFKRDYFGGVYLTTEEHDLVIAGNGP
jgi:hypothetical protein